jgi:hypothetical protein
MRTDNHDVGKLVCMIMTTDPSCNDLIREFVGLDGGKRLVAELIDREKYDYDDHSLYSAVEAAMNHLELYCRIDELVGCMLMSYLRDIVADTLAHDVYDSIGLWLVSSKAEGLDGFLAKRALDEITSGEEDTYFRDLVEIRGRSIVA